MPIDRHQRRVVNCSYFDTTGIEERDSITTRRPPKTSGSDAFFLPQLYYSSKSFIGNAKFLLTSSLNCVFTENLPFFRAGENINLRTPPLLVLLKFIPIPLSYF